ncbi:hypothetical protein OIU84_019389 [Salix udensis]|uniref:Stress-response A/B barrel domain-containing protein n=1 Tax=Salix udensis TaxID=889485 RepID=A0AAD6KYR4_9ROSI|nr:hypothetical protein OIU84_019389 [Salix udensis]
MAAQTPKIVKHTVLLQFKDKITREQIDNLINDYTNLGSLIPAIKSFSWGTDLGLEPPGLNRGYTHAFESTFGSKAGLKEFLNSPVFDEFKKKYDFCVFQILVIDYFLY